MSTPEIPQVAKRWNWQQVLEWKNHNNYAVGASNHRVVTRSQVSFYVIDHTLDNLEIFADPKRHEPPTLPPLMVTMKGGCGSIPNTIITRSFGDFLHTDEELSKELAAYKKIKPPPKQKKGTKKAKTQNKKKKSSSRKK